MDLKLERELLHLAKETRRALRDLIPILRRRTDSTYSVSMGAGALKVKVDAPTEAEAISLLDEAMRRL